MAERLDPIEKAAANPKSMRAGINAYCYLCKEKIKKNVKNCENTDCTLHNVRPWKPKVKAE